MKPIVTTKQQTNIKKSTTVTRYLVKYPLGYHHQTQKHHAWTYTDDPFVAKSYASPTSALYAANRNYRKHYSEEHGCEIKIEPFTLVETIPPTVEIQIVTFPPTPSMEELNPFYPMDKIVNILLTKNPDRLADVVDLIFKDISKIDILELPAQRLNAKKLLTDILYNSEYEND